MKRVIGVAGLLCMVALGACSYTSKESVVPAGASTTTYVAPPATVQQQTTTTRSIYP